MYLKYKYMFKNFGYKKIFFLFMLLLVVIFLNSKVPSFLAICNSEIADSISEVTNSVIKENIDLFRDIDILLLEKDNLGNVKVAKVNAIEINKISSVINAKLKEKLNKEKNITVKVKIARIFGENIFSSIGPSIKIKCNISSNVETNLKSEYVQTGTNQTKHKLYLEVETKARVIFPFLTKEETIKNKIDILESVIISKKKPTNKIVSFFVSKILSL